MASKERFRKIRKQENLKMHFSNEPKENVPITPAYTVPAKNLICVSKLEDSTN